MRIKRGDTSPTVEFTAISSATGGALSSLSGLTATYKRFKGGRPLTADPVAISLTALGSATAAWLSGGYYYLGANGNWRLDLPTLAAAAGTDGADRIEVTVSATDATIVTPLIELYSDAGSWEQSDINDLLAAIVDRQVAVVGPPVPADAVNEMTLYRGDDYLEADGTAVVFGGDAPPCDDLDIENVTVYFVAQDSLSSETVLQVAATDVVDNEDGTVEVTFEFDHDASAILPEGRYKYFEVWVWADSTEKTRQKGTLIIEERWPITSS